MPESGSVALSTSGGDRPNSIRYLKLLLLASVLVPALLFAAVAWQDRRQVLRDAEQRIGQTVEVLHEHALKVFETHELVLDRVAERIAGMDWDEVERSEAVHAYLRGLQDQFQQIDAIGVIDATGTARATSRFFPVPPLNYADRDFFVALQEDPAGIYVSRAYPSRATGHQQFNVARPLRTPAGTLDGAIVISVFPSYFISFYNSITPDREGGSIGLIRADGAVLVRDPPLAGEPLVLTGESGIMRAAKRADEGTFTAVAQLDGVERIYAYKRLAGYPVYISVGLSKSFALTEWYRNLEIYGLFAAFAASGLVLVTLLALRRAKSEQVAVVRWQETAHSLEGEIERRKEVEEALRESEARYRAFFDNTAESLFVIDVTPDGRFLFEIFNPAHERATGLANDMLRGKPVEEVLAPELSAHVLDNYRQCLAAGGPIRYEETLALPGGTRNWETILVPIPDAGGRIARLLGSARDVTERKEAEERLAQAQKMETLGQLTGGVAHDFNNLLTAILNNLELARAEEPEGSRHRGRIEAAMKGARAAAALTQHLLAFARKQPLRPEPVDLNALIGSLQTLIGRSCGENIAIRTDLAADLRMVQADPNQTGNALLNLVVNARDAMPEGGVLTIATANLTVAEADRPGELAPGDYVVLTVADTGTGMPPEIAARIFEPFFTTKPIGKGTGLGLSMVYGFARQSGGTVRVESAPGRGTRMRMYFPAAEATALPAPAAEEPAPRPREAPAEAVAAARAVVLLVEDEALVRMSMVDVLQELGYPTLDTGTADEALSLLDARPEIGLLLTDIGLPGMNGHALAAEARRRRPGLKVVLMTGYDRTSLSERASPDADTVCLEKPFEVRRLAAALDALSKGSRPESQADGAGAAAAARDREAVAAAPASEVHPISRTKRSKR